MEHMCKYLILMKVNKRILVSYVSGFLFAVGWWILVDANVMSNFYQMESGKVTGIHYIPAAASTLSLILYIQFVEIFILTKD